VLPQGRVFEPQPQLRDFVCLELPLRACSATHWLPKNPNFQLLKASPASRSEQKTFGKLRVVRLGWDPFQRACLFASCGRPGPLLAATAASRGLRRPPLLQLGDGSRAEVHLVWAEEHLVRAPSRRCARRAPSGVEVDDLPAGGAESGSDGGRADRRGGS
jgi:hypothetical protein